MDVIETIRAGLRLHQQGELAGAERMYRAALAAEPDHPSALHLLGVILHQRGNTAAGVQLIERAIELHPDAPSFHNNLGEALRALDRHDDAIAAYRAALRLRPDYPEARLNLGIALAKAGHLADATKQFEQVVRDHPNDPHAHWNFALALLLGGDFESGWREYEWRPALRRPPRFPQPRWRGEDLRDRTILLWADQGLGDTIQTIRYAARVAARGPLRVIVECQPELAELMRNVSGVDQVATQGEPLPPFDVQCPLFSLPGIEQTRLGTIPASKSYLSADPTKVAKWRERLMSSADTLRVGLVWAGRATHENDRNRSRPLREFAPLARLANLTFFSLQKGEQAAQALSPPTGMTLVNVSDELRDFSETAAAITNLDLIVTVDTSVAHLAGALGQPVWTILPLSPDWRWLLGRDDSPWYPTMRLFRQRRVGEWQPVFERIANELRRFL